MFKKFKNKWLLNYMISFISILMIEIFFKFVQFPNATKPIDVTSGIEIFFRFVQFEKHAAGI